MSDVTPSGFHVALLGHAHPVLDLGEGLFDGVEVGAIGRQEPEAGAGGSDGGSHGLGLVTSEIVHDDDVARLEGSDQLLFDIGKEAGPVDWAVEDAGCGEPVAAKRRDEGHGAPVPVRGEADKALALRTPAPDRRHVGLDPGLVDEHQPFGIKPGLPGPPAVSSSGDRRPSPLKGEQRFF